MKLIEASALGFDGTWAQLHEGATWRHALYGPLNMRFYSSYHLNKFTDHSVVVVSDNALVAGLRVTTHVDENGVTVFSCFGQPTIFIEARGLNYGVRRHIHATMKTYVSDLMSKSPSWRWEHAEHLEAGCISEFGRHLLSLGAVPAVGTTQLLDLAESEEVLLSGLTKTFRWCVNWGRKNLNVRLLDCSSIKMADVEAFRELHIEAAGRETRNHDTWVKQYEMVLGKEGFLCFGEMDGRLVTAALFPYSSDHCYYGVSASRRELFGNDKPLSHVLLWQAICHARKLGCRWFETGDLRFPYQVPPPSEKEMNISTFKRNFGGRTFVRLRITAQATRNDA